MVHINHAKSQKELKNIKARKQILYNDNQHFSGIINYLQNNSSGVLAVK